MSLRDQLQAIYDEHGKLTPALVVDVARAKTHPLHANFEWNDKLAGESWRREQAHTLIRSVRVIHDRVDQPPLSVREWHAVRQDDGHGYVPTDDILSDPLLTKMLLADMQREWLQLRQRYEQFVEFRELVLGDMEPTG